MNESEWTAFWLQEYAKQLRVNSQSAKSAKSIETDFRNDCLSGDETPSLHSLLVDAALRLTGR